MASQTTGLDIQQDKETGQVKSVMLYGHELLDTTSPCTSELWVNDRPLSLRPHTDPNQPYGEHLKGEHYVDHFTGWSLILTRHMGGRKGTKYNCFGIESHVRRELCDLTCPTPGPGGPVVEAPLYVDQFSILNWNWNFWGADTRMMFHSLHSTGPTDEFGHVGYEHDTPEECKKFMQNTWRRIYPGVMAIHGGLFYNAKTEHWIAITCRQPQVGYILNIEKAGRGVSYDFTLHAQFDLGDNLWLPEIKIYYGESRDEMMHWLGDYVSFYYEEPPKWVSETTHSLGLAWDNEPTWAEQAIKWEKELDKGWLSAIGYSLVTNRPVNSGTTPTGYEPDPNHGTIDEFRAMCRKIADRGTPLLIWMSHSGLAYRGGDEIDDDWFIRGVDGRICAAWGNIDNPSIAHCNPGHPGYIEYTKKWIRFYIKECGCKGIFLDCLGWAFPTDFAPRTFMRYPGDTNRMAVRFINEIYKCIKECDPEAILLGEGTTLEAHVNVFSINSNPKRSIDNVGPRDFILGLNQYSPKRFAVDQGPQMAPGCGYCSVPNEEKWMAHNRFLTEFLKERGVGKRPIHLPDDVSVIDEYVFVPVAGEFGENIINADILLPDNTVSRLVEIITQEVILRGADAKFSAVPTGIYRMESGS